MGKTLSFVLFVLAVLGLLYVLSGKRAPRMPEDMVHAAFDEAAGCLDCHGPGMVAPRKEGHPPKDACLKCHSMRRSKKAELRKQAASQ